MARYEHAIAVTVTVVTHVVTDSKGRRSVKDEDVLRRAAEIMHKWDSDDVREHMEDSGLEYIEALPVRPPRSVAP